MLKEETAKTVGTVHTHTHTPPIIKKEKNIKQCIKKNTVIKIKCTKAITLNIYNKLAIKNNCLFKVQKNIQGKLCKNLT